MELVGTTQLRRNGDRGKRNYECAQTQGLHLIMFQPCEPSIPVMDLCTPSPFCTSHVCATVCDCLRPTPPGWYCAV